MKRLAKNLIFALAVFSCVVVSRSFAAESKKIVFAYSSIGSMATGVWMAKDSGAFDKYGIPADIIFISSGPVVVQALIGGDLQGGSGASNAVINAVSERRADRCRRRHGQSSLSSAVTCSRRSTG